VGAGLLIKGLSRLRSMNPGFNSANVMPMYLQLPTTRYGEILKQTQFRRELLTRLNLSGWSGLIKNARGQKEANSPDDPVRA